MEAIWQSFFLVALSEMGDKTQLLALMLAVRFKKPWPIMAGILVATLLNHGLASAVGGWLASLVDPSTLHLLLAALFIGFGLWILVPDSAGDTPSAPRFGAFVTTVVAFFIAEMGDKTQLATVALGARFQAPISVTIGTTLGMLAADGLAVACGERLTNIVPMKYMRLAAASLFIGFGGYVLLSSRWR